MTWVHGVIVWKHLHYCSMRGDYFCPWTHRSISFCFLLAIAQRLEARWPDSEGQGFDSQKSWSAKPLNGKQTWPTSCRPTTTTYVANHSGPLSLCTTVSKLFQSSTIFISKLSQSGPKIVSEFCERSCLKVVSKFKALLNYLETLLDYLETLLDYLY